MAGAGGGIVTGASIPQTGLVPAAALTGTVTGTEAGASATAYLDALKAEGLSFAPGSASSTSTSSATPPPVAYGSGGGALGGLQSAAQTVAPVDTTAATTAAFGAAKDQTGLETSGALTGLRSALGGRGMLGSGAEIGGTTSAINMGQQQLGAASRANATTQATQAETNALANQGAAVTQRGQDVTAEGNAFSGLVAQRGQDISAQESANSLAVQQTMQQAQLRQSILDGLLASVSKVSSPTTTGPSANTGLY